MDALSDPRDTSKWSADDLITMGFVSTPELAALLQDTPAWTIWTWTATRRC